MSLFETIKHKAKVIGKNILSNPGASLEAAAFGMMVGGQIGFDISIMRELKKVAKAHDALVTEHLNFVEWFNTKFLQAASYNDKFAVTMIDAMCSELDSVKPGFYDKMTAIAEDYDRINNGPCCPLK